jgi:hypothetical protein
MNLYTDIQKRGIKMRCINNVFFKQIILAFIVSICFLSFVMADTLNVDQDDGACGDINGTPFCTIQGAIDNSSNGDTVSVGNGTYGGGVLVTNEITLHGTGFVTTTIIDCGGAGEGVSILSDNSVVSGFKFQDCSNGVDILGSSNTVINNSFTLNKKGVRASGGSNNKINFNNLVGNTRFGVKNIDPDIVDATFNWWGSCDGPSTVGPGSGDNVSVNVTFDPWIGICITNKSLNACEIEGNNATVSANVTSRLNLSTVLVSYTIDGSDFNKTAVKLGNIYAAVLNSSELMAGQNVSWNIFANDTFGNNFTNGNKTFYVRNRTKLSINPAFPDGLNQWYVTEPMFTLSGDLNGSEIYYQWDSAGLPIKYNGTFGLENIPNLPIQTAGILELNYWSDFNFCGNESKQTKELMVDLTNPVIENFDPENNSIIYNSLKPNISAYLDEVYGSNSAINVSKVRMWLDGAVVAAVVELIDNLDAIVWFINPVNMTPGKHNVTVNATDNSGRNSMATWFFELNLTPILSMAVFAPNDGEIFDSRRVSFNITMSEEVAQLRFINHNANRPRWTNLCRNCNEFGNSRPIFLSLNEGLNNLTINASDNFGDYVIKNILLYVDSRAPVISRTLPGRNAVFNGTGFSIRYTEENLKNITLFFNDDVALNCASGRNQVCTGDADLSAHDGEAINYYFEVTDLVRTVKSRNTSINVDTTKPNVTVKLPLDGSNVSRRVQFNVTATEEVKLEYLDEEDARPVFRRLCSRCDEFGESRKRTKFFRKGNHSLVIRATDKAGQIGTADVEFQVI